MAEIENTNLKQEELLSLLGSLASMAGGPATIGTAPLAARMAQGATKGLAQGSAHENIDAILDNNTLDMLQGIVKGAASSGLMGPAGIGLAPPLVPQLMGKLPEQLSPLNQLADMISGGGTGLGTRSIPGPRLKPWVWDKGAASGARLLTERAEPSGQWSQAANRGIQSILDEFVNQLFQPSKPIHKARPVLPRPSDVDIRPPLEPQQRKRGRTGEPRPTQYR